MYFTRVHLINNEYFVHSKASLMIDGGYVDAGILLHLKCILDDTFHYFYSQKQLVTNY